MAELAFWTKAGVAAAAAAVVSVLFILAVALPVSAQEETTTTTAAPGTTTTTAPLTRIALDEENDTNVYLVGLLGFALGSVPGFGLLHVIRHYRSI